MTTLDAFLTSFNTKYSTGDKMSMARSLLQDNVNLGEAVVNVLSSTGIAGFKFHIPESEQVNMESDITDHYTDSNSVIQDHVAKRPVVLTLSGYQGEYFYSVNEIEDALANVTPVLSLVKQFVPKLSAATIQAKQGWLNYQNTINTGGGIGENQNIDPLKTLTENTTLANKAGVLWNSLNGVDLFKLFQDLYKLKSAQTRAFLFFEALWKSEAVFTVETTWKRYDNMMIQKVLPIRESNADITSFTVTFKQMNFAQTRFESLNNAAGRTRSQLAKQANKGISKGSEAQAV